MDVQIFLETLDTEESFKTTALIDSGCMMTSISDQFVRDNKINTIKLPRAITALNTDGAINGKNNQYGKNKNQDTRS
jgi:hypothetical protein